MTDDTASLREAQKRFAALGARLKDTRLANRKAAINLYGWVMRNFDAEGGLGEDGPWEDLAAGGRWKGEGDGRYFQADYKVLQDTGALRQSFEPFSDGEEAGVGAVAMTAGDRPANLAAVHEYGAPDLNLPARPMLPSARQALEIGINVYGLHVKTSIKETLGL